MGAWIKNVEDGDDAAAGINGVAAAAVAEALQLDDALEEVSKLSIS